MRRTATVLTVLLCALPLLAACGDDTGSPGKSTSEVTRIDITFSDGTVTPSGDRVEVGVDEEVELVVQADEPGELHVHSTPEQEFEYGAGTTTLKLELDQPGVVDVESHDPKVVIVQLEVS